MKRLAVIGLFSGAMTIALSAHAVSPASLELTVTRFGLSTSPTCENLTIYTIDNPVAADFTKNPTLGTAAVPNGTYPCVALELVPVITLTPRPGGACKDPVTLDYCALFEQIGAEFDGIQPLGGAPSDSFTKCSAGKDHLVVYLSTQIPEGPAENGLRAPLSATDMKHGFHLGAPLVVSASSEGTLVVSAEVSEPGPGQTACAAGNASFTFESSTK